MENSPQTRIGWLVIAVISLLWMTSCGERGGQSNEAQQTPTTEPDVLVAPVDDKGVPLVIQRVTVVGDGAGDQSLVATVRAMVWKRVNERPDLVWAEYQAPGDVDVCVVVGGSGPLMADVAKRGGSVVLMGDVAKGDANVVVRVTQDPDFSAGQIGEAIWAVADGKGQVIMAPVLADHPLALQRIDGVHDYLERAQPERDGEGLGLVVPEHGMAAHADCQAWLTQALGARLRDKDLSVVVGLTRDATNDALMRMRAIGLSEAVPLIGFGLDSELVAAMDDGEVAGTFVYDPGTLEASIRVALDHAAGVKLGGAAEPLPHQLVPLRWIDHARLGTPTGRAIAAPYLGMR